MTALRKNIKIWNVCVIGVVWNRPPYKPIPLSKKDVSRLFNATSQEYNNITMVFLEYRADFSRLLVTALDNNKDKTENIRIVF